MQHLIERFATEDARSIEDTMLGFLEEIVEIERIRRMSADEVREE